MAALLCLMAGPLLAFHAVHTPAPRLASARAARLHASAPNDPIEAHIREVQKLHAGFADGATGRAAAGGADASLAEHNARQGFVFDEASAFFASADATPPEVVPTLRAIAAATELSAGQRVLDVGTGTGVLIPFYEELGVAQAQVTGVDLSPKMLQYAAERYPNATFVCADVRAVDGGEGVGGEGTGDEGAGAYDAVVFNACFGNLHDPRAALAHAASLVRVGSGRVLVTHPLGAAFVDQLKREDPRIVPHALPGRSALLEMVQQTPLRLERFEDSAEGPYVVVMRRSPVTPLTKLLALRGPVATGFGRGSKKLGVPTANLPCSLFQNELGELERGVYLGWAAVRGEVHKCVANVGFSPTFAEENPEKIVEAHVLHSFGDDFYGESMSLLLLGFVRPERKFGSLDELISTITADIETARSELELSPLREFAQAAFLRESAATGAEAQYEELLPSTVLEAAAAQATAAQATAAQASGGADSAAEAAAEPEGPAPPEGFSWGVSF